MQKQGKKQVEATLLGVAAVMFAVGAALGGNGEWVWVLALRWAAIGVLAAVAVRRRTLTPWIFVAMVAGAETGFDAPGFAVHLKVFSDIFLRLIKTIVAPLILATLITGIAGHGELKSVGRMGVKSLVYFEVLTTLALVIGLVAINISRAGVGLATAAHAGSVDTLVKVAPTHWDDFLLHVFPENIAKSVADAQILQVAVFAVFFGIALASLSETKRAPVMRLCESLSEVMFKFTNLVMYFAPIGVGAAMAVTVGSMGLGVMVNLLKLLLTLYGALAAFALLVMLPVALLARVPVLGFLKAVAEPASIAFATATSEAALPRAMEAMEAFGVPRRIVSFVIPAGYSFNLDGSTLYLALASIFVAQAAGVHMGLGTAAADDGHADPDEQGRGGRPAGDAGGTAGDGGHVQPADGADIDHPGHRRADGHGTDDDECGGELPGERGDREMGRAVWNGTAQRRGGGGDGGVSESRGQSAVVTQSL